MVEHMPMWGYENHLMTFGKVVTIYLYSNTQTCLYHSTEKEVELSEEERRFIVYWEYNQDNDIRLIRL